MAFSFKSFVAKQFKSARKDNKELKEALLLINQKLDNMSKQNDAVLAVLKEMDEETTAIGVKIDGYIAQLEKVKDGVVPDETVAGMKALSAKLKGLAADPTNPIPTAPTEPATPGS